MAKLTSYDGLTALVTGASSGVGRLLALRLAREGARVALVARREEQLRELAAEITSSCGEALVLPCDVAERAQVFAAAQQALDHFGAIDVLVNNAGYGHHRRFLDWDIEDMERMMRVNYGGSLYWAKALLPQMVERRRGWIVFMASVGGKIGVPEESAYAASSSRLSGSPRRCRSRSRTVASTSSPSAPAPFGLTSSMTRRWRGCRRCRDETCKSPKSWSRR